MFSPPCTLPSCFVGILEEDGRLGVGVSDTPATRLLRGGDYLVGAGILARVEVLLARHLGDLPVLAPSALEVAAHGGNGVGSAAGVEVEQRLLLDRVLMARDGLPVNQCLKRALPVLSDVANAPLPVGNNTTVRAQVTANLPFRQLAIQHGFSRYFLHSLTPQ